MKSLKELYHNKWVGFGFWSLLYVLWVIWLGNYWWLIGLAIIFDYKITKKVKWLFWKKDYQEGEKKNILLEWLDAIVFAVVVVTFINIFFFQAFTIPSSSMESSLCTGDYLFVSKLSYGPRVPQTPLTIPFTHNVFMGKESYSKLIQNDYRRLKGFGNVEKGDYVVFNFPHGDTVLVQRPVDDYYTLSRVYGRENIQKTFGPVKVRPSDKTDHYVKRCVASAGDTLEIKDGYVYVNSQMQEVWPGVQYSYRVQTNGTAISRRNLQELGINVAEVYFDQYSGVYPSLPLTSEMLEKVKTMQNVVSIDMNVDSVQAYSAEELALEIFPFSRDYKWTRDNFGPLWIPSKGTEVEINLENLPLYSRIISTYEGHELQVENDKIFIDGIETHSYKFEQDYFFMMGDNRHNSLDSRYWGFVPEDHIVGKPSFIWFSSDQNKSFPRNIRWKRMFKFV